MPRWSRAIRPALPRGLPIWRAGPPDEGGDEEPPARPPFGVPPSAEGSSGNLGPPPPVFRDVSSRGPSGAGSGQGAEPPPPPYEIGGQGSAGARGRPWWLRLVIGAAVLIVLFVLANIAIGLYVDRLWFDELDYRGVFNTRIGTQVWLFFAGSGIAFVFLVGNMAAAWRLPLQSETAATSPFREFSLSAVRRAAVISGVLGALFLAIIFGTIATGEWEGILQFINAESFGIADPQFDKDVGFYVFELEPLQFIKGWATGLMIVTLLASVAVYALRYSLYGGEADTTRAMRMHIALLVTVTIGLFVWGYWLARFELTVSQHGTVFGATHTDVNVRRIALIVMMAVGALAAVAFLSWPFHRRLRAPGAAMGLMVLASLGGVTIYPAIAQRVNVQPNELEQERQFIARNIEATRFAFALDGIEEREFPAVEQVTPADIAANPEALQNIRVWDHRPLNDTLNTLQNIRPLYVFPDVDVDRYAIGGIERQVFLAARELSHDRLGEDQQSWVNRRLQFTHGFGVTVNPVDAVTPGGQPVFFVSNIPPEVTNVPAADESVLTITQPRIYFGEATEPYVIVKTDELEFDFPRGTSEQETTRYDGTGGIKLGGFFKRLVFAWELTDTNILISGALGGDSRIMLRRNIRDRVSELAPFLELDADPYIVIGENGRLYWIQDAYTTTDRFPYSQPHERTGVNYIRNSVKAVIDAYNGSVDLYIVDSSDPIIRVWAKIFPDLFKPEAAFPPDLREHWRYPQDLFQIQADQYLAYHIVQPRTLFNGEDVWGLPTEKFRQQQILVEPYYVTLRLPDSVEPEFLLILPFTPRNRTNAIAWLAGRSDGENYGKLFAFRFPVGKNVFGPQQIEDRIDTDTTASQTITLLGESGSELIRGNLLFIPVADSFVYVEPLYLQPENGRFPLLRGVVVVNGNRIALESTLALAVDVALGRREPRGILGASRAGTVVGAADAEEATEPPAATSEPEAAEPSPDTAEPPEAGDLPSLITEAQAAYDESLVRLAAQDFAGYGEQLQRLETALNRLEAAISATR